MSKTSIWFWLVAILLVILFSCHSAGDKKPQYRELCHDTSKECINDKIHFYTLLLNSGKKHPVSAWKIQEMVRRESNYDPDAVGDLHIYCHIKGKKRQQVYSRGLVQISRCYHPEVSDKQAHDVDFSLCYLINEIGRGRGKQWSTYN